MATSQRKNSGSRSTAAAKRSSGTSSSRSRSRPSTQRQPRRQRQPQSQNGAVETVKAAPAKAWNGAGTVGRATVGAVAGGAALGLAGWAAVKRTRRPRVLGIPLPRGARKLDLKKLSVKNVAKQVGTVAEQLEQTGDDVRRVSAQAKKMSKTLS